MEIRRQRRPRRTTHPADEIFILPLMIYFIHPQISQISRIQRPISRWYMALCYS